VISKDVLGRWFEVAICNLKHNAPEVIDCGFEGLAGAARMGRSGSHIPSVRANAGKGARAT